jgi:hypothetical protein
MDNPGPEKIGVRVCRVALCRVVLLPARAGSTRVWSLVESAAQLARLTMIRGLASPEARPPWLHFNSTFPFDHLRTRDMLGPNW